MHERAKEEGPVAGELVSLRLNGTLLRVLTDGGHIPGWPDVVPEDQVGEDDPRRRLHLATARWATGVVGRKTGHGWHYTGGVTPGDASTILNYLASTVGDLLGSDSWEVRARGHQVRLGLLSAVAYLRRDGATGVKVEESGLFTAYTVLG
jgi:hypothetical protein